MYNKFIYNNILFTIFILYFRPVLLEESERSINEDDEDITMKSNSKILELDRDDNFSLPPCNEDQLVTYLAQLQAINPESIVYSASVDEVEQLCSKVAAELDNIESYLKNCEPPEEKDLYIQLIKGVEALYDKLCLDGPFKKKFLESWPCFHEMQDEFQDCTGPADWTENLDDEQVCSAYEEISDCYYIKTAKVCGIEAAHLMRVLTEAVIRSVITAKCEFHEKEPKVKDAMTRHQDGLANKSKINANTEKMILIISTIILFVLK